MTQDDLMDRTNLTLLEDPKRYSTSNFVDDLLDGYIVPETNLEPGDAMRVREAMRLIVEYESLLIRSGVLEYY